MVWSFGWTSTRKANVSRLHQFGFEYDADEDRLLLKVKTTDHAEIRVWLTQRFIKTMMWPHLQRLMELEPQVQRQSSPVARKSIIFFQRETAIAKTDFSTPYEKKVTTRPAGEEPQLANRLKIKTSNTGLRVVSFVTKEGKDISISLNNQHLHSFCHLLAQAVSKAKWALELEIEDKFQAPHIAPEQLM
jgi:hypothetical protein